MRSCLPGRRAQRRAGNTRVVFITRKVVRPEDFRQLAECAVFGRSSGAPHHHEPRAVTLGKRVLRDQVLREPEIEGTDLHGSNVVPRGGKALTFRLRGWLDPGGELRLASPFSRAPCSLAEKLAPNNVIKLEA